MNTNKDLIITMMMKIFLVGFVMGIEYFIAVFSFVFNKYLALLMSLVLYAPSLFLVMRQTRTLREHEPDMETRKPLLFKAAHIFMIGMALGVTEAGMTYKLPYSRSFALGVASVIIIILMIGEIKEMIK